MYYLKPTFNLIFYSFVFGGTTFYSFVASPLAFKHLNRESFSELQKVVFPYFFQMQSVSPLILGLTAPMAMQMGPLVSLASASVSGCLNLFWLLPWTRRVKEQRQQLAQELQGEELEVQDAPLRKEFGKSHGMSLLFNMTHVAAMLAYGCFLVRGLTRYVPK
ncbi:LANO_0G10242g1_1 [Lachancea nothofagi CBS 11611]|uniref:LANO_0G10242g1_1 n=1 Tax=Lachancea nothofagi CBS 11611 TaxID=1266666 RepID=A0A1G4KIV4_9SACH|nr:LANO_0G10242g1_1 [Lachancea nothofagi CBS 11611]